MFKVFGKNRLVLAAEASHGKYLLPIYVLTVYGYSIVLVAINIITTYIISEGSSFGYGRNGSQEQPVVTKSLTNICSSLRFSFEIPAIAVFRRIFPFSVYTVIEYNVIFMMNVRIIGIITVTTKLY
jgi:hypothetical protein